MKNIANGGRWLLLSALVLAAACSGPGSAGARQYRVTVQSAANGSVSADKAEARVGEQVALRVMPDSGYKAESVIVTGKGEVALEGSGSARAFAMPAHDVTVTAVFARQMPGGHDGDDEEGGGDPSEEGDDDDPETDAGAGGLGPLEIFKGGARRGISVGRMADEAGTKFYPDFVELESGEPGRGGNLRSIKVGTALNANGNAAQQSFALISDTEINLGGAAALSFWARANRAVTIRYVGFGNDDPDERVVYAGEGHNHSIAVTAEWKRYVVPVPASGRGLKTTRPFFLNMAGSRGDYVCIDDIEFVESGVAASSISIPAANSERYYGATPAERLLKGAEIKIAYACDDGAAATLQCRPLNGALNYSLSKWLAPFIEIDGDVAFSNGAAAPLGPYSGAALTVKMGGIASNAMSFNISGGLLLDDFEGMTNNGSFSIPAAPSMESGYIWHTAASGSQVLVRDYLSAGSAEIYSGQGSGSWRPAAAANNPRGGRNFEAKNASGYDTLKFMIRVTAGASSAFQKGAFFTFELRNGGSLAGKTDGAFFTQHFTYDADDDDGWQEVRLPLASFTDDGLDPTAITGYAFSVVGNENPALRISLDDIALIKELD